jgi:hypothetical protein
MHTFHESADQHSSASDGIDAALPLQQHYGGTICGCVSARCYMNSSSSSKHLNGPPPVPLQTSSNAALLWQQAAVEQLLMAQQALLHRVLTVSADGRWLAAAGMSASTARASLESSGATWLDSVYSGTGSRSWPRTW